MESDVKPRIGISSCLLGQKVRHDGGHKRDRYVTDILDSFFEWVPVCPELEVGMGVPRETVQLRGNPEAPRMIGNQSHMDWTQQMNGYASKKIHELRKKPLCGYILKKDSPSCGMERVRVYGQGGVPNRTGRGLFAAKLLRHLPLLPVEEEGRLNDARLRENFIERVFAYQRWLEIAPSGSIEKLIDFHARHKMTLLAHSQKHLRLLGRIVANVRKHPSRQVFDEYGSLFMEALRRPATPKNNTNVLQHIMGFFSDQLEAAERSELLQIIEDYRHEWVPLIVPLTLVQHYVRKYQVAYIQNQIYLNPHPKELMLRNHV